MRRVLVLCAMGAVSACSGGGGASGEASGGGAAPGGPGSAPGGGTAPAIHAEQRRALDVRAARLADLALTASLPVSGTASYAGEMGATAVFQGVPVVVTADVDLTVRFGAGTVSGSFARASSADGTVSGAGTFGAGSVGATGLDAPVTGTLARGGTAHEVDGTFRGAFLGAAAQGIAGAVEARLVRDGAETGRLDGEVWAER